MHLTDAGLQIVELGIFVQTYGQSLHIATIHTAVCEIALELYTETFGALIPLFLGGSYEAAHIYDSVFLGTHGHSVGKGKHLADNLLDGLVGVSGLTCLDEIGILGKTGRIEDYRHIVFLRELAHAAQVFHRNGLAAGRIVGNGNDNERYATGILLQCFFELLQVYITLERNFELRIFRLVDRTVESCGVATLYMSFCRIEMRITGNYIAFVNEIRE